MSYSTLGSSLIAPMRATSSAVKATSTLSISPKIAATFKPKTTMVVGANVLKPAVTLTPAPAVPEAPATTNPPPDAWADWTSAGDQGTPVVPDEYTVAPMEEPSLVEPLVPAKPLPWAWIALGLTATAFLGYAVFKRPMKPNRRRSVRANARGGRRS